MNVRQHSFNGSESGRIESLGYFGLYEISNDSIISIPFYLTQVCGQILA